MATPESNTALGIITDAVYAAGYTQSGQTPDSQVLSDCFRRLVDLINLWQTQGLKLFLLQDIAVQLYEGQQLYVFGPSGPDVIMPKPLRALQGYVLVSQDGCCDDNGIRRPIYPISWEEWMRLPQVCGNNGTVTSFFVDKQPYVLNIHFWNAPDATEANNTAHLLMQTQASLPVNLEDPSGFPQEWRLALVWGLADEIAGGQPQAIMDRCERRAKQYREALEDFDVEDAPTMFAVDTRYSMGSGFR